MKDLSDCDLIFELELLRNKKRVLTSQIDEFDTEIIGIKEELRKRSAGKKKDF